jgi:uncharacterized membrane protein
MNDEAPAMDQTDRLIGLLGTVGLLAFVAVAVWVLPRLPESVPIHFGSSGEPDGWGSPYWFLWWPCIAAALSWLMTVIAHHPGLYAQANLPASTPSGRVRQFALCRQLLLAMRAFVVFLFLAEFLLATAVATGNVSGFAWLTPAGVALLVLLIASYITAALRQK